MDDAIIVLSLPNCTDICPLQTLINATLDLIPQDSRSLCGWSTENLMKDPLEKKEFNSNYNGSISYRSNGLIFILTLLFFTTFGI